jgi:hypothetical protein
MWKGLKHFWEEGLKHIRKGAPISEQIDAGPVLERRGSFRDVLFAVSAQQSTAVRAAARSYSLMRFARSADLHLLPRSEPRPIGLQKTEAIKAG